MYPYSPIVERPGLTFPGGTRLAFWVGLNVEWFRPDLPVPDGSGAVPDPLAHGRRDYGNRVGFWRLLEIFDELRLPITAIVNSDVCTACPQIVDAGVARGWAWVAHGQTNSVTVTGMDPEREQAHLDHMVTVFDDALPSRPTGWLGPALSETARTPRMLADAGFRYLLDWCADDQPFDLGDTGLISVPYSTEINDHSLFLHDFGLTGPDYERIVLDQFEQLLADSATTGRVMALPLHTFLVGQPHRAKYLARVLRAITSTPDVWVCTSDDIAREHAATPRSPETGDGYT